MANEEDTGKTDAEMIDRVWELADKIKDLHADHLGRQAAALAPALFDAGQEEGRYPVSGRRTGAKTWQVDQFPWVSLSYVDTSGNKYVAMTGKAKITDDRKMIKKLWSDFNKAWWDSRMIRRSACLRSSRMTRKSGIARTSWWPVSSCSPPP